MAKSPKSVIVDNETYTVGDIVHYKADNMLYEDVLVRIIVHRGRDQGQYSFVMSEGNTVHMDYMRGSMGPSKRD